MDRTGHTRIRGSGAHRLKALRHLRATHARFNRGADRYEALAGVQREAAVRLVGRLATLVEPLRILEAGCGTGMLTRLLLDRFPRSRVDAVDVSERMLEAAHRGMGPCPRVRWFQTDAAFFRSALPYPLVASSSALHWCCPIDSALRNLYALTADGGTLAVSVMLDGTLAELVASRRRTAPHKDPPGCLPSASAFASAVTEAGFDIEERAEYTLSSRHASAQEMLRHLHDQGLTGGALFRPLQPLTRGELRRLAEDYERHHADAGGAVPAAYRIGWIVARKLPRPFGCGSPP